VRAVLFVLVRAGGFMGVTAVKRDGLRDPVAAERLLEKPQRCLFVPVFRQQKVNRLAVFVDRTGQRVSLALHFHRRFIHAPTDPARPLAAMKHCLERRAVLAHPPIARRVIHVHPTFEHELFDMARTQRIGRYQRTPSE